MNPDTALLETPRSTRLHIGIFGRRNIGKSSLLNAITDQYVAIVSAMPGTTTDPASKPIELPGLGPCLLTDTAGYDDPSALGTLRKDVLVQQALDQGALGFVLKASPPSDLLAAIRTVNRGRFFLSSQIQANVINGYLGRRHSTKNATTLSERESQVLKGVVAGHTTKQIALELFLSPRTVEKHRASLMQKLGTKNLPELVFYAIQENLISPLHFEDGE